MSQNILQENMSVAKEKLCKKYAEKMYEYRHGKKR
jgi:hypothetical protein